MLQGLTLVPTGRFSLCLTFELVGNRKFLTQSGVKK